MKEVAEKAQVSIATVSRVINGKFAEGGISPKTYQRVVEAIESLNYRPDKYARNLKLGAKFESILFAIWDRGREDDPFMPHPFFSHLLNGVQNEVFKKGYYLSYFVANTGNLSVLADLLDGVVAGLITHGPVPEEMMSLLEAKRVPLVAIEPYFGPNEDSCPSVYVDNNMAVHQAIEHLLELGHSRIGFISPHDESPPLRERRTAFRNWVDDQELIQFTRQEYVAKKEKSDVDAGIQALSFWAKQPPAERPTAIITANDLIAIGALRWLRHAKKTGEWENFSVVGIDDIDWAQLNDPPLTTIRIPKEKIGEIAVGLMDRVLQGDDSATEYRCVIKTELVVRESTYRYQNDS